MWGRARPLASEKGEVLLGGVGTLWYLSILSESSACQVPIRAMAAWWFDNLHPKVVFLGAGFLGALPISLVAGSRGRQRLRPGLVELTRARARARAGRPRVLGDSDRPRRPPPFHRLPDRRGSWTSGILTEGPRNPLALCCHVLFLDAHVLPHVLSYVLGIVALLRRPRSSWPRPEAAEMYHNISQ